MSGYSEAQDCPRCDGQMEVSIDSKDPLCCCGQCLECGYGYHTVLHQTTLEEINGERDGCELALLEEFNIPTWSPEMERQYQKDIYKIYILGRIRANNSLH